LHMKAQFILILALLAFAICADDANKDGEKLLEEAQVNKIVDTILASDLKGKSAEEVKEMIKQEIIKEQKAKQAEVYHHVHHSTKQAEDTDHEEFVADEAIKIGNKKGVFQIKHELNQEEEDEKKANEKKKLMLDPETQALQDKYEKMLKKILEENKDAKKKMTKMELIEKAEKEMKAKQQRKPVKTSDRMIAYMEELLRQLNGGTLKNADKFDMKGFVSSIFSRYKEKHEVEKERKRRIIALREHLAREKRTEHQPNFYDEFFTPFEHGYDTHFLLRPMAPKELSSDSAVLQTSVLPHPDKLTLTEEDRNTYLGYEHHSDHTHKPLNMPLVAPDNRKNEYLQQVLGL